MIYCEDCSSYECGCPERKEIESLRQKLSEREKQIVQMRNHMARALSHYSLRVGAGAYLEEALAVTADLDGLILCEKKPVAWLRDDDKGGSINTMSDCCTDAVKELLLRVNPNNVERYTIPLYRAKEQGK